MFFNLTITPVVGYGRELAPSTWTLSEDDVANPMLGDYLREIILDWGEIAREIDELVKAHEQGDLELVSGA
jgi:hypothetical protein